MRSKWMSPWWLALCGAVLLGAGCAGRKAADAPFVDREPLPADTMTVSMREAGVYGGRFVVGATASPKTFNGLMVNETSSNDVCAQLYTALSDINYETMQDLPLVAKSWDFSADARTVTFHLRRGLRFSDGHPITSEDVLFSFNVVMDDSLHPSSQDGLSYVDETTGQRTKFTYSAPDSYTFVVTSPRPYALMLSATGTVRIMPKHVLEKAFLAGTFASEYSVSTPPAQLVTSGPWRLKEFLPDQKVVLERNPYWFGVDARGQRLPYLDELVFVVAKDQDAASLKFHAGELDGLDNVRPEDYRAYERAQQAEKFTLHDLGPSLNSNFFWFNLNLAAGDGDGVKAGAPMVGAVKYAWFNNPVFRRAVSKAVDREALIRGPYRGFGVVNWSAMTPGNKLWYDSTLVGVDYDPEGAKQLLASLGWKDGNGDGVLEDTGGHPISFTMITNADNNMRKDMLNLLRDDLAKVGIRMIPAPVEFNTLDTHIRSDLEYDACLLGLGSAVPPDPGMGQNVWKSSGLTHYWYVRQKHPGTPQEARLDQLMAQLVYTPDLAARKQLWREMATIVSDQCWFIWLPTQVMRLPVRSRFGNVQPSIMPNRILWNIDRVFVKPGAGR